MRACGRDVRTALAAVVGLLVTGCVPATSVRPEPGWAPPACAAEVGTPLPPAPGPLVDEVAVDRALAWAAGLRGRTEACLAEVQGAPASGDLGRLHQREVVDGHRARLDELAALGDRLQRQRRDLSLRLELSERWDGRKSFELETVPPPPPPDPEPAEVIRFPTIDAPPRATPGETFGVQVWLAAERFDEGTQIVQGRPGPAEGSFILPLQPLPPGVDAWKLKVQLSVTGGLEIVGPNVAELDLPRAGDSTPTLFQVRAGAAPSRGYVYATFFEGHAFLGRVRRPIRVAPPDAPAAGSREAVADAPAAGTAPPRGAGAGTPTPAEPGHRPRAFEVGGATGRPPDLSVTIHVGFDPAKPRQAELLFDSPWIDVPRTVWDVPADQAAALGRDYATFANRSARGLVKPGARPEPSARELLLGFGRRQWRAAPLALQVALEKLLQARGEAFQTIQIVTNEPTFPWELVALPDGQLLGTRLAVARWHLAESGGVRMRPPQRLRIDGVSLLAPGYQGSRRLPAQQAEIEAVRQVAARQRGQVRVWEEAGERGGLEQRLRDDREAGAWLLHFAGHGELDPGGAGSYRLDLGQDGLTATEWRELAAGDRAPPFLFLNACNLAQVERVAGLADGWAPASLEAGVAGYVGGLWPIGDRAAAEAARVFYEAALDGVPVAEALRRTRRRFLEAGDPTFLAYVYYGDPRLAFEVAAPGR